MVWLTGKGRGAGVVLAFAATVLFASCAVEDTEYVAGKAGAGGQRAMGGNSPTGGGASSVVGGGTQAGGRGNAGEPGSAASSGGPPTPDTSCDAECPGPSQGSGTGVCEEGKCVLRCAEGFTPCDGACVNLQGDGANCGECGVACDGGLVCQGGSCKSECGAGLTECQASCANLVSAVDHCGECDVKCPSPAFGGTAVCVGGSCDITCDAGLSACAGSCVDLKKDLKSCGGCGQQCVGTCTDGVCCPPGQTNCGGTCIDLQTSGSNCGACGTACASGKACLNGVCTTNCGTQTLCGTSCVDTSTNIANCGDCGDGCAAPPQNGSASCVAGKCGIACSAPDYKECVPGTCTNVTSDSAHCGGCGKACGGVCSKGVCCPTGRVNCNGTCVDLQTDEKNCLSCGRACAAGEVCEGGACVKDCGTQDRCGTTCVTLTSDPYNCGTCGNRCTPPAASTGSAVCSASECDISCSVRRCGNNCCSAPAAGSNTTAACSGTQCVVECLPGFHACGGAASPCYRADDVQRCGASCIDCRQPNAVATCAGTACSNTCAISTLSCPLKDGKPSCGSWDFDSATTEGWRLNPESTGHSGTLRTSTARKYTGSTSVAIGVRADTASQEVKLTVPLCLGGQATNLAPRPVSFMYYFERAAGSAPLLGDAYVEFWNGAEYAFAGCDFPIEENVWAQGSCTGITASEMGLTFRAFNPWTGTLYIDRIRFE